MTIFELVALLGWVLSFALIIYTPFYIKKIRRTNRLRAEQAKADREELERRTCPVCEKQYGPQVDATYYMEPYQPEEWFGRTITRAVILDCPHCEFRAVFDPQGQVIPEMVYNPKDIEPYCTGFSS
jgi:hypothetical protein